jgi:hypothetical protein
MGADLYNEKLVERNKKLYQAEYDAISAKLDDAYEMARIKARVPEGQFAAPPHEGMEALQREHSRIHELIYSEDSYFRDSYNDSSLMWTLEISWWSDVAKMTHNDILRPKDCLRLIELMEKRKPHMRLPAWEDKAGEPTVKEYFDEKYERLIRFLKKGAEDEGIYCSL